MSSTKKRLPSNNYLGKLGSFNRLNLTEYPHILECDKITDLNLSYNNLPDLKGMKLMPLLDWLNLDCSGISNFVGSVRHPNITKISFQGTPLARFEHHRIMALICFGLSLEIINHVRVPKYEKVIAIKLSPYVHKYFLKGWILSNLEPLVLLQPETRERRRLYTEGILDDKTYAEYLKMYLDVNYANNYDLNGFMINDKDLLISDGSEGKLSKVYIPRTGATPDTKNGHNSTSSGIDPDCEKNNSFIDANLLVDVGRIEQNESQSSKFSSRDGTDNTDKSSKDIDSNPEKSDKSESDVYKTDVKNASSSTASLVSLNLDASASSNHSLTNNKSSDQENSSVPGSIQTPKSKRSNKNNPSDSDSNPAKSKTKTPSKISPNTIKTKVANRSNKSSTPSNVKNKNNQNYIKVTKNRNFNPSKDPIKLNNQKQIDKKVEIKKSKNNNDKTTPKSDKIKQSKNSEQKNPNSHTKNQIKNDNIISDCCSDKAIPSNKLSSTVITSPRRYSNASVRSNGKKLKYKKLFSPDNSKKNNVSSSFSDLPVFESVPYSTGDEGKPSLTADLACSPLLCRTGSDSSGSQHLDSQASPMSPKTQDKLEVATPVTPEPVKRYIDTPTTPKNDVNKRYVDSPETPSTPNSDQIHIDNPTTPSTPDSGKKYIDTPTSPDSPDSYFVTSPVENIELNSNQIFNNQGSPVPNLAIYENLSTEFHIPSLQSSLNIDALPSPHFLNCSQSIIDCSTSVSCSSIEIPEPVEIRWPEAAVPEREEIEWNIEDKSDGSYCVTDLGLPDFSVA